MCLSIPVKILEIKDNEAIAEFNGNKEEVGIDLVKDIKVGDYALISNGFIIKKISAQEAEEIFNVIKPKEGKEEK